MRETYVSDDEYSIYTLEDCDREPYVQLQVELKGEDTLFINPRCNDFMWKALLEQRECFAIYNSKGTYCGSIELQNQQSDTPEIGIDLFERFRNQGIGPRVIKLICTRYLQEHKIDYFLVRIMSTNSHSKHVFEKMGAVYLTSEENNVKAVLKRMSELVDTSKLEEGINAILGSSEDDYVLRYKYLP